jgi:hypothetical protein
MHSVQSKCCVYGRWLGIGPGKWTVSIISVVYSSWLRIGPGKWPVSIISVVSTAAGYV